MLKTVCAVIVVLMATIWLPIWIQILLYIIAVFVLPYQFLLLIPALYADALYAPHGGISLSMHLYTVGVAILLMVRWVLVHKTRIGILYYGMEA